MSLDAYRLRTAANMLEHIFCAELDADRRRLAQPRAPESGRDSAERGSAERDSAERDSADIDTDELVLQVLTAVMAEASHCNASDTGHKGAAFHPTLTGPVLRLVADRSRSPR
jgi:hypothetical protein